LRIAFLQPHDELDIARRRLYRENERQNHHRFDRVPCSIRSDSRGRFFSHRASQRERCRIVLRNAFFS
jgi:hypothetical protein